MNILNTITKRKSTRAFTDEQVPQEILNDILIAGTLAPIGMNQYENMHLTIIQNRKVLEKINISIKALFKQMSGKEPKGPAFYNAQTVIVVSSKPAQIEGMDYINGATILENMLLAATELEIDSCVNGAIALILQQNPELMTDAGIPEGYKPVIGVMFGYAVAKDNSEKEWEMKISSNLV